nr:hypothetical protein [Cerasicoccus maritimus]
MYRLVGAPDFLPVDLEAQEGAFLQGSHFAFVLVDDQLEARFEQLGDFRHDRERFGPCFGHDEEVIGVAQMMKMLAYFHTWL